MSSGVRQKIKELLSKYSQGLWAHAVPKLFFDAYKMPFPEQILDNLALLCDICTVEYPFPRDKKKVGWHDGLMIQLRTMPLLSRS